MNISKINAVNFTSKTETQDTNKPNYKKSHTGAITGLATSRRNGCGTSHFPQK